MTFYVEASKYDIPAAQTILARRQATLPTARYTFDIGVPTDGSSTAFDFQAAINGTYSADPEVEILIMRKTHAVKPGSAIRSKRE